MIATPPRCGHWHGDRCRWCHSEIGVRSYASGHRCPLHTPAAVAGRPEPPTRPHNVPHLTPASRKVDTS
jgi:hypothetical protein